MPRRSINDIRVGLQQGIPSFGSWMQLSNASVAEIMGAAGFDWIALDLEHGCISEDSYESLFRAIEIGGSHPFARIGQVTAYAIKAALDAGARGIIMPMIETAAQLHEAISWASYPPRGTRGVGYSRANMFGKRFASYVPTFDPILVAQIEHIRAVDEIERILEVPGLDAVMIGPYDLSASMGLTGQLAQPAFTEAVARVLQACRKRGVASGVHIVLPERDLVRAAVDEGHRFIAYGTDAVFLWKGAEAPDCRIAK